MDFTTSLRNVVFWLQYSESHGEVRIIHGEVRIIHGEVRIA